MPERAILYLRRSTQGAEQQINSLQDQRSACERYAKSKGFDIDRVFEDKQSGLSLDRPGFNEMLAYINSDQCQAKHLIVYHEDRLSRAADPDETASFRWAIKRRGISLHFAESNRQLDNKLETRLLTTINDIGAHEKSRHLAQSVIRGKLSRFQQTGSWSGGTPPYGIALRVMSVDGKHLRDIFYNRDLSKDEIAPDGTFIQKVPRGKGYTKTKSDVVKLIPGRPEDVAVVKRIFDMARTKGVHQIAQALNADGIPGPTGGVWKAYCLRSILNNPAYSGSVVFAKTYKGKLFHVTSDGAQESTGMRGKRTREDYIVSKEAGVTLVDPECFDEVQTAIQKRKSNSGRPSKRKNPLSGMIRHTCGSKLYLHGKTYKGRDHGYYFCRASVEGGKAVCEGAYVRADAVEAIMEEVVGKVLKIIASKAGQLFKKELLKAVREGMVAPETTDNIDLEIAKKEQAIHKIVTGMDPENMKYFNQEVTRRRKEIEALKAQRDQSTGGNNALNDVTAKVEGLFEKYESLPELLKNSAPEEVHELYKMLFQSLIYDSKTGLLHYKVKSPMEQLPPSPVCSKVGSPPVRRL